jgi:histidinol-phosphate aminotransferase
MDSIYRSQRTQALKPGQDFPSIVSRSEIMATPPAYHGALNYAELEQLGLDPDNILDFSVNSNPYGPSPAVAEALATVPLDRYPDREALALRRALAVHCDLSPDRIVIGNGTAELLWLVCFAFLRSTDRVLVIGPTFGEYARLSALMGARVETWSAQPDHDFMVEFNAVAQRLDTLQPRLLFLCNPNNPTGLVIPVDMIMAWAGRHPETLFVIDEAYLAFAAGTCSMLAAAAGNILVLRSMTKDYALAGLRLGYAASHNQAVISALAQARPAWNVNALAQAAGMAALADQAHLARTLADLNQARARLVTALERLNLVPGPSATHFFLVHVGNAGVFRQQLLKQAILVRDCASFGLPAYIRIATRRPAENKQLLAAIQSLEFGPISSEGRPGRYLRQQRYPEGTGNENHYVTPDT